MALTVEIDSHSGFCGGVIRAIDSAESYLAAHPGGELEALGPLVHNEAEMGRLSSKGLRTIDSLASARGKSVLIRAHGEPPRTYEEAGRLGLELIDCTCPVVLKLQRRIKAAGAGDACVVIFGKVGHAEVLGLVGQVGGDAVVVQDKEMLLEAVNAGRIPSEGPVELFSQTTMDPGQYNDLALCLSSAVTGPVHVNETICVQVSSRHAGLRAFAASHDAIVFVAGAESSNGKVLFSLCRQANPRTWRAGSPEEIDAAWFRPDDKVGVCGATSTPKWLLEAVAKKILQVGEDFIIFAD